MNPKQKPTSVDQAHQHISRLIEQLIAAARSKGVTQAQLAQSAGMSAVGLSKAKKRGDIRASSLVKLAKQLDLELALLPARSREKAAEAIRAGAFFSKPDSRGPS